MSDIFEAAFASKLKEFGTVDRLIEEYSACKMKLRAETDKASLLLDALGKLAAEAAGFVGMADSERHGHTNIACLWRRIVEP